MQNKEPLESHSSPLTSENSPLKIWIYQSNRELSENEVTTLQEKLNAFVQDWTAHNLQLKAEAEILYKHFLLLKVDENIASASGCSIDKSVAFVTQMGAEMNVDWFDRWQFAYKDGETVKVVPKDDFQQLYENGIIDDDTIVFNNLVNNSQDMEEKWQVPLHQSWHKNFV